jgi:hypothetical protein
MSLYAVVSTNITGFGFVGVLGATLMNDFSALCLSSKGHRADAYSAGLVSEASAQRVN